MNRFNQGPLHGTPCPAPQYFQEPQTFSTKKARGNAHNDSLPPRPPVKSAPPISRIFSHKRDIKAQSISFKSTDTCSSLLSPHYNTGSHELFFDQCFQIEDKLGVGSFGEVFKVRSKEDGKLYAIKRSRDRFKGESDRRRKLEEVNKHERLPAHPNCVGFVKAWQERQHLYIQTELCQTSLSNYAEQNHSIPETLIWNYLVDLLMAVRHLHNHNLVHMDIKPENIFISNCGTCKLGDFGLVIDMSRDLDYSEAQEGDPKYLAPELMRGKFGKPADIFSLGISILELAGDLDLPRGGQLWHQLRSKHLPEDFLIGLSEELKTVLSWMIEPDEERRPTVDELLSSPIVRKVYSRRKREIALHSMVRAVMLCWYGILSLLYTLWLTITYPLQSLLPKHMQTPPRNQAPAHPPHWDHSFSDDDAFEDEGISIHNNSMGAPLDYSTSSEDSVKDAQGFIIPSVPADKMASTPSYVAHKPRVYLSQGTESPVLSSPHPRSPFYSSSPVRCSPANHQGFVLNKSVTPNCSIHEDMMMDVDLHSKLSIAPKNLLQAFDGASSEDD